MDIALTLLIFGTLVALVAGLIKPNLVIRWGGIKSRGKVLKVYGGLFVVLFIAFGVFGTKNESVPANTVPQKVEQPKVDKAKEAKSEVKFTYDEAKQRLSDWLGEHEFPGYPKLSLSNGPSDGSMYKLEGKEYHLIVMDGLNRSVDILVDPNTGEMFFYDIGLKPEPLNQWYVKYLNDHKGIKTPANVVINKDFEWVEMHTVKNTAFTPVITGVIKNVSTISHSATIRFNLYDAQGNQVGTADDTIHSIGAGNTWKFSAAILDENVASCEFAGISYR